MVSRAYYLEKINTTIVDILSEHGSCSTAVVAERLKDKLRWQTMSLHRNRIAYFLQHHPDVEKLEARDVFTNRSILEWRLKDGLSGSRRAKGVA